MGTASTKVAKPSAAPTTGCPSARVDAPPLGLEHRELIEPALARLRCPCGERAPSDLTFGNLYLFRAAHDYRYLPGRYPCIRGVTYDGTPHLLPLFDLTDAAPAVLAGLLGPGECFYPVPADIAAKLDAGSFAATAVRDDSDYLYRASEFADYRRPSLRGQRSAVRRLLEQHRMTQFDVRHDGGNGALAVLNSWLTERKLDDQAADGAPCREAIHPPPELPLLDGTVYYVDGQPAGFMLTEPLNPGVRVVRFAKGLRDFDGIYPYMFQQYCVSQGDSLQWLNFEQDLGNPHFRKSKLSYSPAQVQEKFRLRPRGF